MWSRDRREFSFSTFPKYSLVKFFLSLVRNTVFIPISILKLGNTVFHSHSQSKLKKKYWEFIGKQSSLYAPFLALNIRFLAWVNFRYEDMRLLPRMAKIVSNMLYKAVGGKIILAR